MMAPPDQVWLAQMHLEPSTVPHVVGPLTIPPNSPSCHGCSKACIAQNVLMAIDHCTYVSYLV